MTQPDHQRVIFVIASAALLAALSASPRAHACGQGMGEGLAILATAAVVVPVDTALSVHDLFVRDSSTTYGVVETLLTVPQIALGGMLLAKYDSTSPEVWIYMLWNGLLATHGVYAWSRGSRTEASSPPLSGELGSARVTIVPAAVSDGVQQGTGLSVLGRF